MRFLNVSGLYRNGIDGLVLDNISFRQRRNQKIAIAGETGSGKSTLLRIIAGLLKPDRGGVWLGEERIDGRDVLVPGHPDIAYLAQDFELPKSLRVEQVLEYAARRTGPSQTRLYNICRIGHVLKRRTDELSGGERQRVAVARLLAGEPRLLLLDEPYTNLDRVHRLSLKAVIDEAIGRLGIACIMISHEPAELLSWADTLIILRQGRIVQRGSPEQLYRFPRNAYVASLLGTFTVLTDRTPGFGHYFARAGVRGKRFVRPEALRLSSDGVTGEVNAVRFLGNHYEVDVNCQGIVVTGLSFTANLKPGDSVAIELLLGDFFN
jgi:iron(III) transport system ATP-binding protein